MAVITEEPEPSQPPNPKAEPSTPQPPPPKPTSRSSATPTPNPFTFWFYFTLIVSLTTLLFISLSTLLSPQDPKAWFLSLPTNLRHHYSTGRTIKVQTTPNRPPIEVFTIQDGPLKSAAAADNVLIVHGLGFSSYSFRRVVKSLAGKGLRAVAIDLPGSGFSDKSTVVVTEEGSGGVFGRFWGFYGDIKEKGLFWGFDQLIEKGYVNYEEENEMRVLKRENVEAIELGPEEMGKVLGQVIDSMALAPVDLVLHDSALGLGANWVLENPGLVRSVTLVDAAASNATALPLWVLEMPVVREIALGFRFVFTRVVELCCLKKPGVVDVEAHRILLKGRGGRKSVVGMGKKLNYSFDLAEWGSSEGVKGLPMQVIWSSGCSEEWSEVGHRVANALPRASFVMHSGGRWPQDDDDAADELAESIFRFLSTLPRTVRQSAEEPIPEHIQKMFDEGKGNHHHHHNGHGGHDHDHNQDHAHAHAGYIDAYGLGQGWAG